MLVPNVLLAPSATTDDSDRSSAKISLAMSATPKLPRSRARRSTPKF